LIEYSESAASPIFRFCERHALFVKQAVLIAMKLTSAIHTTAFLK
jgi:hypothetical protein